MSIQPKTAMRIAAWFLLLVILSPFVVYYASGLTSVAIWVYIWLVVWAVFVNVKWDDASRGIFLIVVSSWVAILGKKFLPANVPVVDAVQNVILLISGGVGGNFIYAYLASKKKG